MIYFFALKPFPSEIRKSPLYKVGNRHFTTLPTLETVTLPFFLLLFRIIPALFKALDLSDLRNFILFLHFFILKERSFPTLCFLLSTETRNSLIFDPY